MHNTCTQNLTWPIVTRAEGNLTWHDGNIPSNELWIKLGGDKGRGSFRFNLQLCNVEHPNSLKNTVLVSVFKTDDSTTNLHTALDMYKDHVTELQGMPLKYGFFNSFYYMCTLCNNYTESGISNSFLVTTNTCAEYMGYLVLVVRYKPLIL